MDNITQHVASNPLLVIVFAVALLIVVLAVPYFNRQRKIYGSMFEFASNARKVSAGVSSALLLGIAFYAMTPYVAPPSSEMAIVLGNTQNSPAPSVSDDVSTAIRGTMLMHKGDEADSMAESIKVISAIKHPEVIDLGVSGLKLKKIGNNSSNAKRDADSNIVAIEAKLNGLGPTDSGANYLEAIFEAADNVEKGSKIVVIGSGLSDSGDLNFSKTNILTNEDARSALIKSIKDKYGSDYLEDYEIEFYGLGDTTAPQEALSNIQKGIIRDIYETVIRKLGGKVKINTKTQTGASIKSDYVVGTTDTGCGDIDLIFDDDDLKFVGDQATFVDKQAAVESLSTIKDLWGKQRDTIESIRIDGYTAHYPGADSLSQERADAVKQALADLGVSADKMTASGQGFGPYELDAQNRTVKVNISRNSDQCNV